MDAKIIGLEKVQQRMTKITNGLLDLSKPFDESSGIVIQEFKANFDSEGATLESPWKPRMRAYPWPILQKTGKMKGNWEKKADRRQLEVKNPTEYAAYHHFGTAYLPIRKLVAKTSNLVKMVTDRLNAYVKTLTR